MSLLEIALYLFFFFVCVLLSGFFSSAETAFISLQRFKLQHMIETKVSGASRVARMVSHPAKLLSVILLSSNFFNTAAAAIATVLAVSFWGETRGALVATVVVTIILLVFSDAAPKTYATQNAERLSLIYAKPIEILSRLLAPFVILLSWITSGLARLSGATPPRYLISDEEIRTMISVGHKEGSVEPSEARLLHRVFDFGDRTVKEVMVPRAEIIAIEKGATVADFLALFTRRPLSRLPVYQDTRDNIVGIISIKDVLMALAKNTVIKDSPIDSLIRPAYFAPETKRLTKILAEMQAKNHHLAIIVDEYGGTAGIVGISGLIEEIVGPVGDELDGFARDYEIIDEYTFQVDGNVHIEEANEKMGLGLPEGDYETVAGFVLHLLGRIPRQGEQLRYKDLKLVITRMTGMKIEEILVTREKKAEDAATAR